MADPTTDKQTAEPPLVSAPTVEHDAAPAAKLPELPLLEEDMTRIDVHRPEPREWLVRLLILLLGVVLYLPHLGGFGLWDPWETHYGEVTRNMIETYDWIAPWWGFKEQIGTERINGDWFFSKPIYTFWAEAVSARIFGLSDFAIRLPIALLAIAAVFGVYFTFSRIVGRKMGVLAAVVMATSPQFFFIARQAQTDMPFVATMVLAMCAFILGVFGPRRAISDVQFRWRAVAFLAFLLLSIVPQLMMLATDLSRDVSASLPPMQRLWMTIRGNGIYHALIYGAVLVPVLLAIIVPLVRETRASRGVGLSDELKDRALRRFYILAFYILLAHSTLAKGLLGFLLPGFIIGVFLLLTRPGLAGRLLLFFSFPPVTWPVLRSMPKYRPAMRFEPILGFMLFLLTALPWYLAMFARFGRAYYNRFFIHDHFNRLESGVHQIDTGTFEHFIKWLGYGVFPWVAFVPFVLLGLARLRLSDWRPKNQLRLLLVLWTFLSYALFTLSATKFHHYIFPALPPLAVLTGWFLFEALADRSRRMRVAAVVGGVLLLAIAWDIHEEPQQLRNLMTYQYERPLPAHLPIDPDAPISASNPDPWRESTFFKHTSASLHWILAQPWLRYETFIRFVSVVALLGFLLFFFVRTRGPGVVVVSLAGVLLCLWSLNYYMPTLSPHWSQKYLFEAYYEDCELLENPREIDEAYTPLISRIGLEGLFKRLGGNRKRVCREDVISWLLTWRGETYYSYNEIRPINREATQFEAYLREHNRGQPFYLFIERGRVGGMEARLNNYTRTLKGKDVPEFMEIDSWVVETVHDENQYFVLAKATPNRRSL